MSEEEEFGGITPEGGDGGFEGEESTLETHETTQDLSLKDVGIEDDGNENREPSPSSAVENTQLQEKVTFEDRLRAVDMINSQIDAFNAQYPDQMISPLEYSNLQFASSKEIQKIITQGVNNENGIQIAQNFKKIVYYAKGPSIRSQEEKNIKHFKNFVIGSTIDGDNVDENLVTAIDREFARNRFSQKNIDNLHTNIHDAISLLEPTSIVSQRLHEIEETITHLTDDNQRDSQLHDITYRVDLLLYESGLAKSR